MTFGSCSLPGKKLWQDVTEASMPSAQPQSGPGEHSLHTMYKSRDGRNFMTDRLVDYSFSFFSPPVALVTLVKLRLAPVLC